MFSPSLAQGKTKSLIDPLIKTAAALGIIEGLIWTLLSITELVWYYSSNLDGEILPEDLENIGNIICFIYFDRRSDTIKNNVSDGNIFVNISLIFSNILIYSKTFVIFVYIYLILSLNWLIISSVLLWALLKGKKDKNLYFYSLIAWTVLTSIISLLDFILLCLLSADYHEFENIGMNNLFLASIGIFLYFSIRGIILWIINVIFAIILGKHACERFKQRKNKRPKMQRPEYIDGFDQGNNGRNPWEGSPYSLKENENNFSYNNQAFINQDHNPSYEFRFPARKREMEESIFSRQHLQKNPRDREFRPPAAADNNPIAKRNFLHHNNSHLHNDKPIISPSELGQQKYPRTRDQIYGQPNNPAVRTAKIGHSGQKSPPLNVVRPPHIPEPDYSPSNSPNNVRGVLRPNSNYASMY